MYSAYIHVCVCVCVCTRAHLESCQDARFLRIWWITSGTRHTAEAFSFGVKSISYSDHSTHLTGGCENQTVLTHKIKSQRYIQINTFPLLTHSSFAIRVSVDLTIVLDDGQAGRNGGHHLILTVLRAGAASWLLTAAVIAIEHPKRVSPLPLWTWGAFSLHKKTK